MGESTTDHPYRPDPPPAGGPRHVPWIVRVNVVLGGLAPIVAVFFFDAMSAMCWFLPDKHDSAAGLVVIPIMLIALGALMVGNIRGQRAALRSLGSGVIAYATLRADRVTIKNTHYLRFTFEHDGQTYELNRRTPDPGPLVDDRWEQVVFWPGQERRASLVDELPGRPRIREDNTIDPRPHIVGGVSALVLLAGAAIINVVGACLWLR